MRFLLWPVCFVVICASSYGQISVPGPLTVPGALLVCLDSTCAVTDVGLVLPALATPSSYPFLNREEVSCTKTSDIGTTLERFRHFTLSIGANSDDLSSYDIVVTGTGFSLPNAADNGVQSVRINKRNSASIELLIDREQIDADGGTLLVLQKGDIRGRFPLLTVRMRQYLQQVFQSPIVGVGRLGTHDAGFRIDSGPLPPGYIVKEICYWAIGGQCGSQLACTLEFVNAATQPRLRFHLNRDVQNIQVFMIVIYELQEQVQAPWTISDWAWW